MLEVKLASIKDAYDVAEERRIGKRDAQPRTITAEMYEELQRLADDGCPLVMDLEKYQIV